MEQTEAIEFAAVLDMDSLTQTERSHYEMCRRADLPHDVAIREVKQVSLAMPACGIPAQRFWIGGNRSVSIPFKPRV